ncbi:hypothetical protein [Actinoallomurus sp. NPDC052274]|uniref:hypothetical protein n=1 Tax=Actinoallomurus sp. NPDC052274 TaxID=3155420 RepID=UPI0034412FEC
MLGYRPPRLYWYDSFTYLSVTFHLRPSAGFQPGGFQPSGYPIFLWVLQPLHSILLVAGIQHLMGLAIGGMTYALLRRRSVPVWGAIAATIPVLFDASFLRLEQGILPDALFIFLVMSAVTVTLWSPSLSTWAAVSAGLLLAAATLVRTIGLPLLVVLVVYVAVGRVGWRPLATLMMTGLLPLAAYACWFRVEEGRFSLADGDGVALWARTMTFADCSVIKPPATERYLCPNGARQDAAGEYVWDPKSSINQAPGGLASNNDTARSFAIHAIAAQPFDYLMDVIHDVSLAFTFPPARHPRRIQPAFGFARGCAPLPDTPQISEARRKYDSAIRGQCSVDPYAGFLIDYQYPAYLPGPLLAVILFAGAVGAFRRPRSALFPWVVASILLVAPVAILDFDHRYVLPVIPLACLAAALGIAELARKSEPS